MDIVEGMYLEVAVTAAEAVFDVVSLPSLVNSCSIRHGHGLFNARLQAQCTSIEWVSSSLI